MTMMEKRYENLRAIMREKGIDALYINSPENHLYVSGFDNPDGWLFVTLEKIYVFADFRYTEALDAATWYTNLPSIVGCLVTLPLV